MYRSLNIDHARKIMDELIVQVRTLYYVDGLYKNVLKGCQSPHTSDSHPSVQHVIDSADDMLFDQAISFGEWLKEKELI